LDSLHKLLVAAASIAKIMFLSLVASTTLTRLAPILKAKGIVPRISALLGTFLCMALAFLPKADLGPGLSAFSTALILIGASLSFVVLRWLGKSPYRCRHFARDHRRRAGRRHPTKRHLQNR
jgi:hypothetical protein